MSRTAILSRKDLVGVAILVLLIFIVFPMALDVFRLNLVGK